jgi:NADH dehydrogenase FAD-containing subunit
MSTLEETSSRNLSFWHSTASQPAQSPLAGDIDVDVAIVGGGFTGLWTAYYQKSLDP